MHTSQGFGFPDSSVGKKKKKSACNAGDPGLTPGIDQELFGEGIAYPSAGEGIGYTLQYSWASLVA